MTHVELKITQEGLIVDVYDDASSSEQNTEPTSCTAESVAYMWSDLGLRVDDRVDHVSSKHIRILNDELRVRPAEGL